MEPIPLSTVLDCLPQELNHEQLIDELYQLKKAIKKFFIDYYHTRLVDETTVNADKLLDMLGVANDGKQWAKRLCKAGTKTRWILLRIYIAKVLWACVDPRSNAETTLLPVDVVRCYQAALLENRDNDSPPVLDYWRAMTASALANRCPRDKLAEKGDLRADNIKRTVADLLDVLKPFEGTGTGTPRPSLEEIVTRFAILGFKIFSDVNPIEVVWRSGPSFDLFPALKQYRLDDGRRLITIKEATRLYPEFHPPWMPGSGKVSR